MDEKLYNYMKWIANWGNLNLVVECWTLCGPRLIALLIPIFVGNPIGG